MEYSSVVGRNLLTWETRPSHSHLPQANVKNLTGAAPEWSAVSADVRVDGLADSLTRLWRGSIVGFRKRTSHGKQARLLETGRPDGRSRLRLCCFSLWRTLSLTRSI